MKAYVRVIANALDDYTARKERMEYLTVENAKYKKILDTLNELEISDTNNELIATIKNKIERNTTFIEIYKEELREVEQSIEDTYDKATAYNSLFASDVNAMVETMRENVASDIKAGYSTEKVKEELDEIDRYRATQNNIYEQLFSEPNTNERFFAYMVNKGAISID